MSDTATSSASPVGVVGLGSMGFGMAGSLVAAGLDTYGFDVTSEAVERFVAAGGKSGDPQDLAGRFSCVVLVVLNASQSEQILFGPSGLAARLSKGTAIIACATVPPEFAADMAARCEVLGLHYLDAPISGGSVKAAKGQLTIMASGADAAFAAAQPALDAMAERVFNLGPKPGTGSAMKAVNQLLAGVHIAAMAEAMTFGMAHGVDGQQMVDVISQCAGSSWMFENRGPHVVAGDYTPHSAVDIWLKDLGIVLDMARGKKFGAPLTAAALQQFLAASGSGLGAEDDAAVAKIYARNAGLDLPAKA